MSGECWAGRRAFLGGHWATPCPREPIHVIASPEAEPIELCDEHFQDALMFGLVTDPYIGSAEFERRERLRRYDQA